MAAASSGYSLSPRLQSTNVSETSLITLIRKRMTSVVVQFSDQVESTWAQIRGADTWWEKVYGEAAISSAVIRPPCSRI
ncbi:hypothetical protein TYRP_021221 [Tyrophagus putrescentiae]|nr:hypothetical protein TYRP_021221 [Tyrophagus putrescentiae]